MNSHPICQKCNQRNAIGKLENGTYICADCHRIGPDGVSRYERIPPELMDNYRPMEVDDAKLSVAGIIFKLAYNRFVSYASKTLEDVDSAIDYRNRLQRAMDNYPETNEAHTLHHASADAEDKFKETYVELDASQKIVDKAKILLDIEMCCPEISIPPSWHHTPLPSACQ